MHNHHPANSQAINQAAQNPPMGQIGKGKYSENLKFSANRLELIRCMEVSMHGRFRFIDDFGVSKAYDEFISGISTCF